MVREKASTLTLADGTVFSVSSWGRTELSRKPEQSGMEGGQRTRNEVS